MNRNDMHTPISKINHTHAQTIVLGEVFNQRWMSIPTMSRNARKHDVELGAIRIIDFAKEFIVCNVPCEEILSNGIIGRADFTHKQRRKHYESTSEQ